MSTWIVEIGNGSRFVGPFPSKEDADQYAQDVRWSQAYQGFSVTVSRLEPMESLDLRAWKESNGD